MRPPTAEERQGASPPAVSIATVMTGIGEPIRGLTALVYLMLQQLRTDAYRAGREQGLEQEDCKAEADREHRGDEQQRNRGSVMPIGEGRSEQKHDHEAGEQRRKDRQEGSPADQAHGAVKPAKLPAPPVLFASAALEQLRLDRARTIHDP